jgi:uncharacterized membrane protein
MTVRTRRSLAFLSAAYLMAVGLLFGSVPLAVFNVLLTTVMPPLVWLLWVFARALANQHADQWARDVDKVHGGRPRPIPDRVR